MSVSTTPFGQRSVTLEHIAGRFHVQRLLEEAAKPGSNHPAAINKWTLFRTLTEVRERLGVSDRSLGVLNALLTFHPETALTLPASTSEGHKEGDEASCELVVFPSNKALALRAHGMAEATLRRHLACLVDAGLIQRRDSPNGKRYARKDTADRAQLTDAFGFDLTPLVARAAEFETLAEELRAQRRRVELARERITLLRRDIAKLIACAADEEITGPWETLRARSLSLSAPCRRIHEAAVLESLAAALVQLRAEVLTHYEAWYHFHNMSGNDADFARHQSNSNTERHSDFEPACEQEGGEIDASSGADLLEVKAVPTAAGIYPLAMVLEACPDVKEHAVTGDIRSWPDFISTLRAIRPMLGISVDAWEAAVASLGEHNAAVALATILQRCEHSSEARHTGGVSTVNGSPAIRSPGGYLRALTRKASAGEFVLGPVLMALMGQRLKAKRGGVV